MIDLLTVGVVVGVAVLVYRHGHSVGWHKGYEVGGGKYAERQGRSTLSAHRANITFWMGKFHTLRLENNALRKENRKLRASNATRDR